MKSFEDLIQEIQEKFSSLNCEDNSIKTVNYGKQITLVKNGEKVTLTVYNGKKGIKMVWGGKEGALLQEAQVALGQKASKTTSPSTNNLSVNSQFPTCLLRDSKGFKGLWAGSDESGKGDFFGPLVVASVMLTTSEADKLIALGVKDCKELSDSKILALAKAIQEEIKTFVVLALTPKMYNYRYKQMQAEHHNLNTLLAKGHVAVLTKVLAMNPECNYVLVDRFAVNNTIEEEVQAEFPKAIVVQRPRAEEDIAVAAASVLARARFLEIMEELSKTAGLELPKGGGQQATDCAKSILASQGREVLNDLVKQHFANYKKL